MVKWRSQLLKRLYMKKPVSSRRLDAVLTWCVLWHQVQQSWVGRRADWKQQVNLGCLLRMSLRPPSRSDLLVLGQSGSLWAFHRGPRARARPATPVPPGCLAGWSRRAETIRCATSCAHGPSRNHPLNSVHKASVMAFVPICLGIFLFWANTVPVRSSDIG